VTSLPEAAPGFGQTPQGPARDPRRGGCGPRLVPSPLHRPRRDRPNESGVLPVETRSNRQQSCQAPWARECRRRWAADDEKTLDRPSDLPDFRDPPLNEVLLGVQFAQAKGYSQIRVGEVWGLFKSAFPEVEEQPPLQPSFEVFGLPQAAQGWAGFVMGPTHNRFWFLTRQKDELIQFQHDRLLHNWRKVGTNEYAV
jgi:hypothetical protein